MANIDCRRKICTLINVFTVPPARHDELFELLKKTTQDVMQKMPGYISTSLHLSDDRTTITNYVQWASQADFKNMMEHPEALRRIHEAAEIATAFKPVTYQSVWCG
jgi:heme-degrading monooxygenase HmoA